jgi:hypothetical protein
VTTKPIPSAPPSCYPSQTADHAQEPSGVRSKRLRKHYEKTGRCEGKPTISEHLAYDNRFGTP